ncbi:CocE/NonD family hydrolase [Mesorhizobium sp. BAC0120]|uniref:CocE/NonD family hydrolase n=1 Tax=Mesorhizobium sp. BAC0120 TaxID=3090670 RepID=UPI00298C407B|nr:CocE/NonD family hydrolase [Mesorhizobium sp. BAC0120]MDW6023685.1 CocE/NonD family hydrolase [Mesorhizobium sp. BAC0120]
MRIETSCPHPIRRVDHFEIPMPDGCRLAARMWLPVDAEETPVPAILEYIPYRKNDLTAQRDAVMHPYVAGHGYAVVRVDLRGTGDSDGLMLDEYLQQELDDGCSVIEWLAKQSWCDGNVGMVGISWGGFNGLQIAALRPPALKAIITCASTDDRYADDVHYMGGTLLIDNLSWASIMFGRNTLPPDPRNRPDDWRELWHRRLKESGLWLKTWLEHPHRDEFWKRGSVCEDFGAITCPVYAVSGWADGYCRSVFRLMEKLTVPRKGLVGPWAHTYPNIGKPGPAIGFLQECLRWWDHWLKGRDTGIMDEPMLRLFMQDGAEPRTSYESRSGRWVTEPSWPSPTVEMQSLFLGENGLLVATQAGNRIDPQTIRSPLSVGLRGGKWCSYAVPGDQPADQRADDAGSLIHETEVLESDLEIAGEAMLDLSFESDKAVAQVAVRLSDVAPNGAATRVSYGLLNLTHRNSHEQPEPLEPGRRYHVSIPFKHVAQRFAAGHRIRLAISTGYFPVAWPAPEAVTLTIYRDECRLQLPVRIQSADEPQPAPFEEPVGASPLEIEMIQEPEKDWKIIENLADGSVAVEVGEGAGIYRMVENDLTITSIGKECYSFSGDDLGSVKGETKWTLEMSRGAWRVGSVSETALTATPSHFLIEARLRAWEGDVLVHEQKWTEAIPRQLV